MAETLSEYCARTAQTALLSQWDAPANLPLTPGAVTHGSKRRVWWVCGRGHRWETPVFVRTGSDAGCPYCAGKRPWPGETDLAAVYPHLAEQWHPEKNGSLTPLDVLPGSHRKAWWLCERGHEWEAAVKSRSAGAGCPVCAGRVTDDRSSLAALYPEVAGQWHPEKNGTLTPDAVAPGSDRRVWWRCGRGHEWQARIFTRTGRGTGCPYCAGRRVIPGETDLASVFPDIAAQWHPEKNGPLTPAELSPYSNAKVWWLCARGHAYRAPVSARASRQSSCPYCTNRKVLPGFNDLGTRNPTLADQWHPTLNGALTPEMVTFGSRRKVWWQCRGGHVWKAVIYSRTGGRKSGCPVCAGKVKEPAR